MSTANKLSYLNDTKSLLRTSLNKFGSSILSTDTFRSYDTKLNDIYDKLPKVTQSGAGFTLSDVQNGLLDDFKMNGVDLEQDTTNGNQLLNFNLTPTKTSATTSTFIDDTLTVSSSSGTYKRVEWDILSIIKNNPSRVIKFGKQSYSSTSNLGNVQLRIKINNTNTYVQILNNNYTIPSDTTTITEAVFQVYSNNSETSLEATTTIVKPLLYFDNNNTYEPYTGGIPSPNPDYPQEIKVVEGRQVITDKGKNLFNFGIRSRNQNGITTNYNFSQAIINGTTTTANSIVGFATKISEYSISLGTYSAGSYVFKFEKVSGNLTYPSGASEIHIRNSNDTTIFKNKVNSETTNYTKSFTLEQETELFIQWFVNESNWTFTDYICRFMIISDTDSATDYEPYYNPVSYNIDLNLENIYLAKMPNTTYKNRIYKNNGNWYFEKNIEKVVFDGSSDENWQRNETISGENRYYQFYINFSNLNINILDSTCYSKHFKFSRTVGNNFYINFNSSLFVFPHPYNANGDFETVTAWKNWLSQNNDEIYVPIETITTQITNTTLINQLEAISVHTGTNIITISNSNNIIPEIEITRLKELEKLA